MGGQVGGGRAGPLQDGLAEVDRSLDPTAGVGRRTGSLIYAWFGVAKARRSRREGAASGVGSVGRVIGEPPQNARESGASEVGPTRSDPGNAVKT